uniref:Putative secreted protein n=1 Tax=Anopheles darlingi TaxID=43151 RepID=A0A2M4DIS3_ANODA
MSSHVLGALPIALRALGCCGSVQTPPLSAPSPVCDPYLCPHFWFLFREATRDTKKRFYLGLRSHPILSQWLRT